MAGWSGSGVLWNPDDSDEELENSAEFRDAGRTASLMIIDSSPAMFETWAENQETPFRAALKVSTQPNVYFVYLYCILLP
jgi:hypothetical protein